MKSKSKKMKGNNFSVDHKQYLQEMIFDYDQKLNTNIWSDFQTYLRGIT